MIEMRRREEINANTIFKFSQLGEGKRNESSFLFFCSFSKLQATTTTPKQTFQLAARLARSHKNMLILLLYKVF